VTTRSNRLGDRLEQVAVHLSAQQKESVNKLEDCLEQVTVRLQETQRGVGADIQVKLLEAGQISSREITAGLRSVADGISALNACLETAVSFER
jgi:hypothetical protein